MAMSADDGVESIWRPFVIVITAAEAEEDARGGGSVFPKTATLLPAT